MFDWRHLFDELRRRNVFRAVVAYWVVAWTCIEVSSVFEQALLLPEWLDQMFVLFGVAGLPIVVVLSWLFEWGPTGLIVDVSDKPQRQITDRQQELASRIASEVYRKLLNDLNGSGNSNVHSKSNISVLISRSHFPD